MPDQASPLPIHTRGVSNAQLDAVREVALVAAGGDLDAARLVSKGKWNAGRGRAGHPELLTAEALRQKLKLRHWHHVLAVAFLPPSQRAGAIGSYRKRVSALSQGAPIPRLEAKPADQELIREFLEEFDFATPGGQISSPPATAAQANGAAAATTAESYRIGTGVTLESSEVLGQIVSRALRAVAFRLGHSPSAIAYDDALKKLESERARAGLPPLGFPDSKTIIQRIGSWAKALTDAGLEAPPAHTRPKGQPTLVVLDACVDSWGILPGWDGFREWCNHCQLSVAYHRGRWVDLVEQLRAYRAEHGKATPEAITYKKRLRPPLPSPEEVEALQAKLGGPRRYRRRTAEEAREGIRIYAREHLAPGEQPGTRSYLAACKRDARLVWASKLKGLTGKTFTGLCAEEGL